MLSTGPSSSVSVQPRDRESPSPGDEAAKSLLEGNQLALEEQMPPKAKGFRRHQWHDYCGLHSCRPFRFTRGEV
jgi:hypothetical protein